MDRDFNPEGIAASEPQVVPRSGKQPGVEAAVRFNSNGVAAIATASPRAWLEIQVPFGHNLFEVG